MIASANVSAAGYAMGVLTRDWGPLATVGAVAIALLIALPGIVTLYAAIKALRA